MTVTHNFWAGWSAEDVQAELRAQRKALLTSTHVRHDPGPNQACLVVHRENFIIHWPQLYGEPVRETVRDRSVYLCAQSARYILQAVAEVDFPGLKQAIRRVRYDDSTCRYVIVVRRDPCRVATMYNDEFAPPGFDPVGLLDRALILAKEPT